MIRRSYVGWKKFDGTEKLESGKVYMTCEEVIDGLGNPSFATYYRKGDVVRLELRDDYEVDSEPLTEEERLMQAIFGRDRKTTIPFDGFYILTGDYGIDSIYEGCLKQPVCVINALPMNDVNAAPGYWAEAPLEPEGLSYGGMRQIQNALTEKEQKEMEELREKIESDPILANAYKGIVGSAIPGGIAVRRPLGPCTYDLMPSRVARRLIAALDYARAAAAIPAEELQNFVEIESKDKPLPLALDQFTEKYGITDRKHAVLHLVYLSGDVPNFYECRDRRIQKDRKKNLDIPAVLQEARAKCRLPYRIGRTVNLLRMGAPEVILHNELREWIECECMLHDSFHRIVHIDPDQFAFSYGVYPDGTRREGEPCNIGDAELMHLDPDLPEDEWKKNNESRFIWAFAPNFLMCEKGGPILDRETWKYLRDDDGNIKMYAVCPREEIIRLNGGQPSQKNT